MCEGVFVCVQFFSFFGEGVIITKNNQLFSFQNSHMF